MSANKINSRIINGKRCIVLSYYKADKRGPAWYKVHAIGNVNYTFTKAFGQSTPNGYCVGTTIANEYRFTDSDITAVYNAGRLCYILVGGDIPDEPLDGWNLTSKEIKARLGK